MAIANPDRDRQDRNVEIPGDTGSADIVGPTGEQMPQQSHDGLEDQDRVQPPVPAAEDDEGLVAIRSRIGS